MSKLKWDAVGERTFETGVTHGVFYTKGTGAYTAPSGSEKDNLGVVWNGLTGVTESPSGADANDLWADDMKYATLRSAETFGGTIEAYTYPDAFAECDGSSSPVAGLYLGQQMRKSFGFCYRTAIGSDTDSDPTAGGYKLHIIYNATASPSERQYATINDSPDAITFSWEITTTPIPVTGEGNEAYKAVSCITIDSTKVTNANNLEALEDILYGKDPSSSSSTDGTPAWLPNPEKVIEVLSAT